MDTDAFLYSIFTDDYYSDILNDINKYFDTTSYGKDNLIKLPMVNKKVLGVFKDVCGDNIMIEYIGVKSKCYCISNLNDETKKIKGIKKSVVDNEITVDEFRNCVFGRTIVYRPMTIFKSKKHFIYTQVLNKEALSFFDDKRYQIEDSFKTLAWGHKDIPDLMILELQNKIQNHFIISIFFLLKRLINNQKF